MTARKPSHAVRPLTDKEAAFCREYIVDKNQMASAVRAGYSARTANSAGAEVFARPVVQTEIRRLLAEQEKRTLITADKVLLDIERFGNDAAKAGEFHSAIRSRELLGKHYKLFTDRLEVKDTTPRAERLRAARERLKRMSDEE